MTQYYKMPGFTLAGANLSTKVLLTLFLVAVALGLVVALLQYGDRAGLSGTGAVEWIRGNEGDLDAAELKAPKSRRELLALTHDHAFALPMLLFVLLHLVALTSVPEGAKIAIYVFGFASLGTALASPWLVAYVGEGWQRALRASGFGLAATIAAATLLPLHEMWLARRMRRLLGRGEPRPVDPLFPSRRGESG